MTIRLRPALLGASFAVLLPGSAQVPRAVPATFETKKIAAGGQGPSLGFRAEGLDRLCLLLHEGRPLQAIQADLGWSSDLLNRKLALLESEGLVKADGRGAFHPTFLVLTRREAATWMAVDPQLVSTTCALIKARLPVLEARWRSLGCMRGLTFREGSLFLLSDVLLDDLQIRQVEAVFLRASRPVRNGQAYYFSLQEAEPGAATEAFGIYGNALTPYGDVALGLYGNRRMGENLNTLSGAALRAHFGMEVDQPKAARGQLVQELLDHARQPDVNLPSRHLAGFEYLGLVKDGHPQVPVLDGEARRQLEGIAGLVSMDLLSLLNGARASLQARFNRSPYLAEVTFEEFLIWWYHFFYTRVTDQLIAEGVIEVPPGGVFTYLQIGR
jgi:hypothetical protein